MTNKPLPAEQELYIKRYGKYIAFLRRHPTHAIRVLFGIVIVPHESVIVETIWQGFRENIIQCSRGTSKTFVVGSLYPALKSLLYRNCNVLVASASGFRGGKMILKDSERLVRGHLKSQFLPGKWALRSGANTNVIKKDPDMWTIDFNSYSSVATIPTNNEEAARGFRANVLVMDERNSFDSETVQVVFRPFLNVGTDFENPAAGSEGNQIISVGTINYTYKDWYKEIKAAEDTIKIEHELHKALMASDKERYEALLSQHREKVVDSSLAYVRFDYTDLLIPTVIDSAKVHYPGATPGKQIRWDERDRQDLIFTYPVSKKQLESPLDQGITDVESWEAEQRNVFIRTTGTVYPPSVLEKVTGPLFTQAEEKKRGWDSSKQGTRYTSPVLFSSDDPCVLGVDVARSADLSAFVVIRVGIAPPEFFPSGAKTYSLKTHSGPSAWSNVIWAEQHQQMTGREVAAKIRELKSRYNIIRTSSVRGIVMDWRGGGAQVRDELAKPTPDVDSTGRVSPTWKRPESIFDPEDDIYKNLITSLDSWGGLKLLATTDLINQELVSFSRAQMDAGRLFVCPSPAKAIRISSEPKMLAGYLGAEALKLQLLRIQAVPTQAGKSVRFDIPGDHKKLENKKDTFMAFLYACYALRIIATQNVSKRHAEPVAYGSIIRL